VRDPQLNIRQFVGRKDETRKLVKLFESTLESGPVVVALSGEAGVGKSTLVRQLVPELRLRAGSLVGGRCLEADVKRPYAPWAEAIPRSIAWASPPPTPGANCPDWFPSSASQRRTRSDEVRPVRRNRGVPAHGAESRPFVIVLDDMQWADTASWDVLEHLMATLERERVLICLTIRAEDADPSVIERLRR
jgi:predicted ATPase